jgi:hypothetical protein
VTIVGLSLPNIVAGAVIAEAIFNFPGMGLLFWQSALQHDFPVMLGATLIIGVATVVGNLAADVAYGVLDPRIRHQSADGAAVAGPLGVVPEGGEVTTRTGGRNLLLGDFLHSKRAMGGCGVVLLLILFCFAGPLIYRTNQTTVNLNLANLPPGNGYPLGTDAFGFDILGRLMTGGQSSLELGFAVAITSTVIGSLYGAVSGMIGGIVDALMPSTTSPRRGPR